MIAPYPYFGGKRAVAERVWSAFGRVDNYVEPFFGSGAVLLARLDTIGKHLVETINDADGFVSNFWRAVKADPDAVAFHADFPVSESDLEARHLWLVNRLEAITEKLNDAEWFDAKVAGWWVWGASAWIGGGWCSGKGPWILHEGRIVDSRQLPHLSAGMGVNRQLPHVGNAGRGELIREYMRQLSDRFRNVRIACGDWSRVTGESVTVKHGTTAVFLDPPYSAEADRCDVYAVECGKVAHDVREWAIANGDNPLLRIILCGYGSEHDMPARWRAEPWKAAGGYGSQGNGRGRANCSREMLWYSPHCLDLTPDLFATTKET